MKTIMKKHKFKYFYPSFATVLPKLEERMISHGDWFHPPIGGKWNLARWSELLLLTLDPLQQGSGGSKKA